MKREGVRNERREEVGRKGEEGRENRSKGGKEKRGKGGSRGKVEEGMEEGSEERGGECGKGRVGREVKKGGHYFATLRKESPILSFLQFQRLFWGLSSCCPHPHADSQLPSPSYFCLLL